ncbi:MAG: hypothetical protein O7C75_14265 [Verrucomicrobia bacterium]|nr:hypothetical protein [Verrucomicrobiota bacterium]
MKRGWLTILFGLAAGLLAQNIYFNTHKPCDEDTLECKLTWIKDYLSLTSEQFEIVLAMHKDHQPEIEQLQEQIEYLETRLAAMEAERIENDRIDFLAFYSYLQEKVDLDKTYTSSTNNFLKKVGSIMNTKQKERFDLLIRDFRITYPEGS